MTTHIHKRIDWRGLDAESVQSASTRATDTAHRGVRWMTVPLAVALCLGQAFVTIVGENISRVFITSTMIPVLAFAVLLILVLAVNPFLRLRPAAAAAAGALVLSANVPIFLLTVVSDSFAAQLAWDLWRCVSAACLALLALRLLRFRPFSRAELVCVFASLMVTAGISTFGLVSQLVPIIPAPHNPDWNTPQRGWSSSFVPHLRPELYVRDEAAIQAFYQGVTVDRGGQRLVAPPDGAPWSSTLSHYGRVFVAIPWGVWIPPLACWLIFVAAIYALFYSLTYVVLPHWRDGEKLIFPLAKLPEALLPEDEAPRGVAAIFRSPAFWLGFAVAAAVWVWNVLAQSGWIDPSFRLNLGMSRQAVDAVIQDTAWEGLGGSRFSGLMFLIIFTAIGIAFLLPLEISFSIWFYFLVGKAVILIAVWMGYGRTAGDFPSDWLWLGNPVTAQGGGALFLFSAVSLYRCLREYARLVRGKSVRDAASIALPVAGLVVSLAVAAAWLTWNHVGWFWSLAVVLALTLLTVGLMRIVAESGVYWFQSHTSFFHLYKTLGLGKFFAAPLMAPLIPIYSVLFLDIKTFLAPSLLNAAAMGSGSSGEPAPDRGGRARFHLSLVLSVAVTVVFSLVFAIFLAHLRGGLQGMDSWFYRAGPMQLLDITRDATREAAAFNPVTTIWWAVGALWLAVTLYLRTTLFWFPHPIGYVMLMNPMMSQLWFSFFIGWACKRIVMQYGGKTTFERVRGAFIGLIVGELIAIAAVVSLSLFYPAVRGSGVDLNRYTP